MSLATLPEGWKRFGAGRRWRCQAPHYLCEVDDVAQAPSYAKVAGTVAKIRRIQSAYRGRVPLGSLDEFGTGVDILVANSLTESFGTVPSPLETRELRAVYERGSGTDDGAKLDGVVRHIASHAKYLQRMEPGYANPVATPGRVSVGAHHVLISTALDLIGASKKDALTRAAAIRDLVCRVPAESLYAAELAVRYFNKHRARHLNEPPLLAATYNAGSPRLDPSNPWNLKQYGDHITRWVSYYNTSVLVSRGGVS
jgi:hypothetical protein